LRTSGSPVFNSYSPQPNQFVIDLTGASKAPALTIPTNLPATVHSITAEEVTEMGTRLTRVTVILTDAGTLQASAESNAVNIPLPGTAAAAAVAETKHETPLPAVTTVAASAEPPAPKGEPVPELVKVEPPKSDPAAAAEPIPMAKATTLRKIETSGSGASIEVQLAADGDVAYNAFKLANPPRVVVDLNGVKDKLPKNVVSVNGDLVKKIRVSQFK